MSTFKLLVAQGDEQQFVTSCHATHYDRDRYDRLHFHLYFDLEDRLIHPLQLFQSRMPLFERSSNFRIDGGTFVDNSVKPGEHCPCPLLGEYS